MPDRVGKKLSLGNNSSVRIIVLLLPIFLGCLVLGPYSIWKILKPFSIVTEDDRRRVEVNGNAVISAIETFSESNGRYPKSLEELEPDFYATSSKPDWGVGFWTYKETDGGFILVVYDNMKYKYPHIVYHSDSKKWAVDQ